MKKIMIGFAALALTTGAAFAQDATTTTDSSATAASPYSFSQTDTDESNDVTLAEAQAVWPDLTEEQYQAADADKDGTLDQQEFDAFVAGTEAPPSASTLSPTEDKDDNSSSN